MFRFRVDLGGPSKKMYLNLGGGKGPQKGYQNEPKKSPKGSILRGLGLEPLFLENRYPSAAELQF